MPSSSYYDIDCILAQEELIPCTTSFDFSRLAHLSASTAVGEKKHYLEQGTQIKMPLWALDKWAPLGFVRMTLPRHFGTKARQRLEADPAQANLRKQNERFFLSGRSLIDLVDRCASQVTRKDRKSVAAMMLLSNQVAELKRTLLLTFTGERLERTLDLMLSGHGQDLSHYARLLDEMEVKLLMRGVASTTAHEKWKNCTHGRIQVPLYLRAVTPDAETNPPNKRQKRS